MTRKPYKPKKIQIENYLDKTLWVLAQVLFDRSVLFTFFSSEILAGGTAAKVLRVPPNAAGTIENRDYSNYSIANRSGMAFGHSWVKEEDVLHLLIQPIRHKGNA